MTEREEALEEAVKKCLQIQADSDAKAKRLFVRNGQGDHDREKQVSWGIGLAVVAIRSLPSSPPPKGGDEQARSAAPHSASTEHGNEGHDQ